MRVVAEAALQTQALQLQSLSSHCGDRSAMVKCVVSIRNVREHTHMHTWYRCGAHHMYMYIEMLMLNEG